MFALFFSPAFQDFLQGVSQFPTVIFTALVLFVMLYWLSVLLGVFELDGADVGDGDVLSGLLMKFGLNGVPILVILTIFALAGWLISFIFMGVSANFLLNFPSIFNVLANILVLLVTVAISLWLTNVLVRPIRKVALSNPTTTASSLVGKIATVRTSVVDANYGEAILEDGGAGLILKVRAVDSTFALGDKVRLTAYLSEQNAYRVVLV
ncbi:hypothetical protein [Faucicola boevrei]|uniref:hypothetical protein n=1 Tax=Faucicola boevrei TaxID=346665 RepID=UPI00037F3029|nr:hypothetical protein [Moraxella boevrei]